MNLKYFLLFKKLIAIFICCLGILYSETINIYDTDGKLVRQNLYSNGILTEFYTFVFDISTNKIKQNHYNFNGALLSSTTYEYNSKNLCVKKNRYHSNGTLHWYEIFEYNDSRQVTKKATYSSFNYKYIMQDMIVYTYNDNSMRVDFYNSDENHELQLSKINIEYYTNQTTLTEKHLYNAKGVMLYRHVYFYSQYDQLIREEIYNPRNIKLETINHIVNTNKILKKNSL